MSYTTELRIFILIWFSLRDLRVPCQYCVKNLVIFKTYAMAATTRQEIRDSEFSVAKPVAEIKYLK